MSQRQYPTTPLLAACTAIWRGEKILLAMRRSPPNADRWAMPGGLVETGETLQLAAIREAREETALKLERVVFNRFHEIIRRDDQGRVQMHYVLAMFVAICDHGDAVAGDDAAEVAWFGVEELGSLPLTPQTEQFVLESRDYLPHFN